ncbi:hypothetical protein C1645_816322 [Glomus cerebriforme]|uniref:Ion transport domain-containing protein n=1 Tax=Glomus cerebriforme TaxID=658196 RepID=A0A397TBU9_9GLOM|nr:hypothetical protein C1645_816322 [Glomus cerebriforme]
MSRRNSIYKGDLVIGFENDDYDTKEVIIHQTLHNGKPITMIEVSPNGTYFVTYSEEDKSFVCWNVGYMNDNQLVSEIHHHTIEHDLGGYVVHKICVSDDKKLAYTYFRNLKIIDMINGQEIELDLKFCSIDHFYCTFNLKNEYILHSGVSDKFNERINIIFVYSTQTKNNKWICKRTYKIPKGFELISISKYDKLYLLFSNNYIYEWDLLTEKSIRMFGNDEVIWLTEMIRISSNEKFICLKINDKIIIYSIELKAPIITLDINIIDANIEKKQQVKLSGKMKQIEEVEIPREIIEQTSTEADIIIEEKQQAEPSEIQHQTEKVETPEETILLSLLNGRVCNSIMEYCKKKGVHYLKKNEHQAKSLSKIKLTKYVLGILNGYVMNFSYKISDKCEQLNAYSFNLYVDDINAFLQNDICCPNDDDDDYFTRENDSIRWEIKNTKPYKKLELRVFKKNNGWESGCTRTEEVEVDFEILEINLFKNNDALVKTDIEQKGKLAFQYRCKKEFSKHTLPLPNFLSFELCNQWVSDIIGNKNNLLKYGVELLSFAIKEHNLELIERIYKKCIFYFKEDLRNNKMLLSIITSTIPLLNEYYHEYTLKCSLETNMIIDSPSYNIEHQNNSLHLYSQYLQIDNLTHSILWIKYNNIIGVLHDKIPRFLKIFQYLAIFLTFPILPILSVTFYLLSKYHYINDFNFNNNDYNWFLELIRPQSSPFVKSINGGIYKTWNGEALINFKWNTYGKYYYTIIWISFIALLGCFTAVATAPSQYIDKGTRKQLLITSIILGFIHLSFEIRQFIYNPIKWINDFWNIFDVIAYLLPIITSIKWLQTNDMNDHIIQLLSFSCLFLDIKFLLFFRAFESFGVYFAIIISVAKQIIYFLLVLFIIVISFAHAFYILLFPRSEFSFVNNNDPNNPWTLASTYNQMFENGTINPNPFIVQTPNENTNMFTNFGTALFAMYKFLTGDSSALSNWIYLNNQSLVILIVLFSLLIVVYLMNLFIGLLNMAINKDNNRVSYLLQKAEILAEIELFYLLPYQRRWDAWFPEVIYYYANVDKTREEIKKLVSEGQWDSKEFSELKKDLLEKLKIQDIDTDSQQVLKELEKFQLKTENDLQQVLKKSEKVQSKAEIDLQQVLKELEKIQLKSETDLQQVLKEIQKIQSKTV